MIHTKPAKRQNTENSPFSSSKMFNDEDLGFLNDFLNM